MRLICLPAFLMLLGGWGPLAGPPDTSANAPQEEESREAREAARVLFNDALQRADRADYEGALREFTEAYQLSPNFAVLYNIGQAQIETGRSLEAARTLSQYLRDGQDQIPANRRQQVEQQIGGLLFSELTIQTARTGVAILLDGGLVGRTPLDKPIRVAAGTHTISAVIDRAAPIIRTFTLGHGGRQILFLDLSSPDRMSASVLSYQAPPSRPLPSTGPKGSLPALARSPAKPDPTRDASVAPVGEGQFPPGRTGPRNTRFTMAWTAVGLGAVFSGAALTLYLRNRGRYEEWRNNDVALNAGMDAIDYHGRQVTNNQLAASLARDNRIIEGLSIAGGALVAGGLAFLMLDRQKSGAEGGQASSRAVGFNFAGGFSSCAVSWNDTW